MREMHVEISEARKRAALCNGMGDEGGKAAKREMYSDSCVHCRAILPPTLRIEGGLPCQLNGKRATVRLWRACGNGMII